MKKLILLLVMSLMSVSFGFSQTKGYVGGTINMNFSTLDYGDDEKTHLNFVSIIPSINFMLNDNWSLGVGLGYIHAGIKDKYYDDYSEDVLKINLFQVRPTLGYYFKLGNKFYYNPTLQVGVGFGKMVDEDIKLLTASVGVSPLSFEFRPTG